MTLSEVERLVQAELHFSAADVAAAHTRAYAAAFGPGAARLAHLAGWPPYPPPPHAGAPTASATVALALLLLLALGMVALLALVRRAHRRRGASNPRRWLTMGAMPAAGGREDNAKYRAEKAMAALDELDNVDGDGVTSGTR